MIIMQALYYVYLHLIMDSNSIWRSSLVDIYVLCIKGNLGSIEGDAATDTGCFCLSAWEIHKLHDY